MKKAKKAKKGALSMRTTLILFAIIPMIISAAIISVKLLQTTSDELSDSMSRAMVSIIKETGAAFDNTTDNSMRTMQAFVQAPVVKDYLKNPDDADLKAKAQQYTVDFYGKLDGWEGLYIADWSSKVLTHPSDAVVGMVMREGDALTSLQDAMLAADGVYNVGIITSPASGQLIMSLYLPIFDGDTPIGYAGAGTIVSNNAGKFSDVKSLGLETAYIYFVDAGGTMLYHPTPEKIGNPVENAAVKGLVERLSKGEHPTPECIEYEYKGAMKYAAYYVDAGNNYIAVLTADKDDVLSHTKSLIIAVVGLAAAAIVVFAVISILIAQLVMKPLTEIAKATEKLSTGDVTVECEAKSNIKETVSIIAAFKNLKKALETSMTNVKNSATALNDAIISVDGMTANNVESVSQINNAIDEVATTSQAVAESAQTMAEKAVDLGMNIETLTDNVSRLFEDSLTIKSANDEATSCMKSVYAGANESVKAMQTIADKITETNNAITDIESAVQAIESIAAQTNLLSLNASIEAARAGEAGRGFAVVADEIRTLADSSAESAKEIKQIIENVIALSNGTVEISNRVYDVISKEQADIENTQGKFNVLSDSVEASIAEINTIKEMTGKLDAIKTDLTNATSDLGAISEELGASAEEVAASCQTVTGACEDTQNSTEQMRTINDSMSTSIDFFKLS